MTYSCGEFACVIFVGVVGMTGGSVSAAWVCFLTLDRDLVMRLNPFKFSRGAAACCSRLLSCSFVGYALGVKSSTVMEQSNCCNSFFVRGAGACVPQSRFTRSTISFSRFIRTVFPSISSTRQVPAARAASLWRCLFSFRRSTRT